MPNSDQATETCYIRHVTWIFFFKYHPTNTFLNKAFCFQSSYFRVYQIPQYFYWDLSYLALHCILYTSFIKRIIFCFREQSGILEFYITLERFQPKLHIYSPPHRKWIREEKKKEEKKLCFSRRVTWYL